MIAIVAGLALLALMPLVAVGIFVYARKMKQDIPPPIRTVAVPPADWGEVIPQSYWVIGPFGPGHDQSYEPEQQPDPAKPCKTPDGKELEWVVKPIIPGA